MTTQHFFTKIQSQVALPTLNTLIIELENHFEELLRREIFFVSQCYNVGATIWWRKFLHIGVNIPADLKIRHWILSKTHPPLWMCFNPKVMKLAHEHFEARTLSLQSDLKYARQLVKECVHQDVIDVCDEFAKKHFVL